MDEVTITDPFPGNPDPHDPGIPSPVTNPGTPIPIQPGVPGGGNVTLPTTELGAKRFHEFVHQARFANNLDQHTYEYGLGFEHLVFGVTIERNNAGKYSYRMYQK